MKPIGGLLRHGRPGERREFAAAFVVGAVNDALRTVAQINPTDARATSFAHGVAMIGVSHGAVAGNVQRSAAEIIHWANNKIHAAGGGDQTITRIVTRPQPIP